MKPTIVLVISCLIQVGIFAQQNSKIPNWSFGAQKGYAQIEGEIKSRSGFAFGFYTTKHFNKILAVKLEIGMGEMQGMDEQSRTDWSNHPGWNGTINPAINYNNVPNNSIYANYKTNYMEASLQGVFMVSQLPFLNNKSPFDVFLFAGIGGMRFDTHIDAANVNGKIYDFEKVDALEAETKGETIANLNAVLDGDFETQINNSPATTPLYQAGIGMSWKIKDQFTLSLAHRISITGTDLLDTYESEKKNILNSTNDLQHFTSVSLSYALFKQEKLEKPQVYLLLPVPTKPFQLLSIPMASVTLPSIVLIKTPLREMEPIVEEKVELSKEEEIVVRQAFDNLEFETGRSVIRSASYISLNELAVLLSEHPSWKLKIEGHTDNQGEASDNMKLSRRRAEAVRDHLVSRGLAFQRFLVTWYGEERPISTNKYKAGRQQNRRVEMEIVE